MQESRRAHRSADAAIGALCFSTAESFPDEVSSTSLALPYRCRADRLYLPIDADIDPVVSDNDLQQLLAEDRQYVWHPSIGMIGFDAEHVLSFHDLLMLPEATATEWDAAELGVQLNGTIRNLLPEPTPDDVSVLDLGQDDIGTESGNLDDAPRSPDEKSGAAVRDVLQNAADGLNTAFFKLIRGVTSALPTSDSGSKLLGRLHAWADSVIDGAGGGSEKGGKHWQPPDRRLTTKRENELKRLMNLLQNDPDEGLKYALPMGGDDNGRGMASPTDRLLENRPDFNLGDLRQSGRADFWDMPWEHQAKLIQTYRELAQREQRLGRYRRAAYIYASLLGDMSSAAKALEEGRLFHDAAGVYLEHLKDPVKAAECLRRGGFWEDAVQIYRHRERWMDAANLYSEIGELDNAREMYHREIKDCQRRREFSTAGELADRQLDDPEFATTLLFNGWMQNANGSDCFRKLMSLNGRRGNHRDAMWALQQLTDEGELGPQQIQDALNVCSESAVAYPDEMVRTAARQHTFRLAATLLKAEEDSGSAMFGHSPALAAIRAIAESDRLLQADTYRYEERLKQALSAENSTPRKTGASWLPINVIGTANFEPEGVPEGTTWIDIVCDGTEIYRCGVFKRRDIVLVRQKLGTRRDGRLVSEDTVIVLPNATPLSPSFLYLCVRPEQRGVLLLSRVPREATLMAEDNRAMIRESGFIHLLERPFGLLQDVCDGPAGGLSTLNSVAGESQMEFELNFLSGQLLPENTFKLDLVPPREPLERNGDFIRLYLASHAFIVQGKMVFRTELSANELIHSEESRTKARIVEQLPEVPTRIIGAPKNTLSRLVFTFAHGARVLRTDSGESCAVAADLVSPVIAFTSNGVLVACCRESDRVCFFRLERGQAEQIGETSAGGSVRHLTCGTTSNQILLFLENGDVTQLEVPVR